MATSSHPFAVDDVDEWAEEDYGHDINGHDINGHDINGASFAYVDTWDADPEEMDDPRAPAAEQAHRATGSVPSGVDPLPRDYDDYFDDDEEELDDVNATSAVTRNALEWAVVLVGAVLVALLLRASLFQAFWIPSESMEATLLTDDRVLVNKVSYRLHDINRGDIVVFERPVEEPGEIRDLIKRVIALPGETVEATEGSIYINGQRLVEPYLDESVVTDDFSPTVVPEGEIFVMGDNRGNSQDSRFFGTVSEERVVGRAFVLFWPLGRVDSL
jgi:signal peptidase I